MSVVPSPVGASRRRAALVTPEAVTIDLPLADLGSRSLAILVDLIILFTLQYAVVLAAVLAVGVGFGLGLDGGPGWLAIVAFLLLNFAILWGVPVACEVLLRGRTPGKALLGLRVVTVDGGTVRFRHASIRWLLALVDFYLLLGIPAIVTSLVTSRNQRLGDLAAGTVVIRDRVRRGVVDQPVTWQVPPALVGYARTLDVSGLDGEDYSLVRTFLLRSGSFAADQRQRIGEEVAATIAQRMRHRRPAGMHPEALLVCAAALVQQRDTAPVPTAPDIIDPFAPA